MLDCQDCETVGLPTLRKCEVLTEAETETVTERKDSEELISKKVLHSLP